MGENELDQWQDLLPAVAAFDVLCGGIHRPVCFWFGESADGRLLGDNARSEGRSGGAWPTPSSSPSQLSATFGRQLLHEPLKETRHRKPLRPNPVAPCELRVGQLRVLYEVAGAESGVVRILAVGRKRRNVLVVGDKEIRL